MTSATSTEKLVEKDDNSEPCYDKIPKMTDHQESQANSSEGAYDTLPHATPQHQEMNNSNGCYDVLDPVTRQAENKDYEKLQPLVTGMQAK